MSDIESVRVEVDYKGNVYFKYQNECYNILFDLSSETGVILDRISNESVNSLINLLEDHSYLARYVKRGKIVLSDVTLKGRVTQIISQMEAEEYDEHAENNQFTTYDFSFKESEFFRIERIHSNISDNCDDDEDSEDYDDWDINDTEENYTTSSELEYRFSGVVNYEDSNDNDNDNEKRYLTLSHSMMFSNMLNDLSGHYDTIMIKGGIESKIVVSNVQRTDGYCTQRLVLYTDGICKIQFPNTYTIYSKIVYDNGLLSLEFIKKIDESSDKTDTR